MFEIRKTGHRVELEISKKIKNLQDHSFGCFSASRRTFLKSKREFFLLQYVVFNTLLYSV